jgi:hypothetical protein
LAITVLALTCILLSSAHAEDTDPSSRVARISYLKGRVFMQPAETDAWTEARINRPLTSGDQLWTEANSRSELQIGSATLQLDASTQLRLLELSDAVLQVEVAQGLLNVHVRSLDALETVELDTPNAAINALHPGTYRVDVSARDNATVVQVRDGSAEVAGERQTFTVNQGEQLRVQGTNRLAAAYDDLPRMDEFDRWSSDRNQRTARSASSRYVASDVIGYEDLDGYGDWRWYQDYGYVWRPTRVNSGWTPYRDGNWAWISPWGWTWVDAAPWGFAPFHYGRWARIHSHWHWVPGPRTARAVYAPALVAWMNTPGLSIGINLGSHPVGWVPLGPREVYRPNYRVSERYVVNINISNSLLNHSEFERGYRRQPHEVNYSNRTAISVTTGDALRSAQPVNKHLVNGDHSRMRATERAPTPRPDSSSVLGGERRAAPPQVNSPIVFARRQPNPSASSNRIENDGRANIQTLPRNPVVPERNNIRVITPSLRRGQLNNTPTISERTLDASNSRPFGERTATGNNPSGIELQPRDQRATVNTPYVRPDTSSTTRGGSSNQGARAPASPSDNRDSVPVQTNSGGGPTPSPQLSAPAVRPSNTDTPRFHTYRPSTPASTERSSRNNTWVGDGAALRRGSIPQTQAPSEPATVATPRSQTFSRPSRSRSSEEQQPSIPAARNSNSDESDSTQRRPGRYDMR